jgi:peroxiredoxin Q/BCP
MAVQFSLPNQNGELVSSDDFRGNGLVMFFYPRAMTPGCTTEACDFRDNYSKFEQAGYQVIGVSPDPPSRNAKFREKEGHSFHLLSHEDHALASQLGAWGEKNNYRKKSMGLIRTTFVYDPDGEMVAEYRNVKATGHVARVAADLLGS